MASILSNTTTLAEWEEKMVKDFEPKPSDLAVLAFKKRVFSFLTQPSSSRAAYYWSVVMTMIIIGSVLTLVLQTVYDLSYTDGQKQAFFDLELFFTLIFLMEYVTRLASVPDYGYLPRLMIQPSWVIDLVAILPFFVELILIDTNSSSLAVIRVIRLLRVFRLFKAHKNAQQVIILANALKRSKDGVFLLLFLMLNLMFISASFVFFCEQAICERHDDGILYYTDGPWLGLPSQFQSIPHSLWWAIVTLCTVGYGDMYPTSGPGKFFGALTMFCGALCLGFPTTIIGIHMSELYDEFRHKKGTKELERKKRIEHLRKLESKIKRTTTVSWGVDDQANFAKISQAMKNAKIQANELQQFVDQIRSMNLRIKQQLLDIASGDQ